jgi:hypothetical protein
VGFLYVEIDGGVELSPDGGEWIAGIGRQGWIQPCQAGRRTRAYDFLKKSATRRPMGVRTLRFLPGTRRRRPFGYLTSDAAEPLLTELHAPGLVLLSFRDHVQGTVRMQRWQRSKIGKGHHEWVGEPDSFEGHPVELPRRSIR